MWELDYKESWAPKNWCFWTVVLEKALESPLDCKAIQPVNSKGDQSWIFIERTDVEAETPTLWPPRVNSWLIGKDPDVGRDWGQEEKGTTEDEMAGWHHWLNGCESGWTPGVGDGQGGLACCDSWGRKESDTTERLNWTEQNWFTLQSFQSSLFRFDQINPSSQCHFCFDLPQMLLIINLVRFRSSSKFYVILLFSWRSKILKFLFRFVPYQTNNLK